jgi:hypothetical protein
MIFVDHDNMIDLNKEYTTKDGNAVKLFEIHKDKIIGMVIFEVTSPYPTLWEVNGKHISDWKQFDLVEVIKPKTIWVNAYDDGYGFHLGVEFDSEAEAINGIDNSGNYIKTIKITNEK